MFSFILGILGQILGVDWVQSSSTNLYSWRFDSSILNSTAMLCLDFYYSAHKCKIFPEL